MSNDNNYEEIIEKNVSDKDMAINDSNPFKFSNQEEK